jgi:hypothetical protein
MKYDFWIILLLFSTLCISLNGQKYEIYKGDTINYVDAQNQKQKFWIYFTITKKKKYVRKATCK